MIDPAGRAADFFTALCRLCLCALPLGFAVPRASAADNSEPAPLAANALLLDVVNTGSKIVAVGDHGVVVVSTDQGKTWRQSPTPTRVLLTAVCFVGEQNGWAVGHDGVILATSDGGQTWIRQDDGQNPDTVLLDVRFLDEKVGFAVGAYGRFLSTSDGGRIWTAGKPSSDEVHFNRLSLGPTGDLYLAGESGTLLVSTNRGKDWRKVEVPYDGSLFGAFPLTEGALLVYGLRGHIFRSDDQGASWAPVANDVKVLISSGLRLKRGPVVLAGQAGNFFVSRDAGQNFSNWKPADFSTSVAAVVEAADGAIVTVGEAGAVRVNLPP